MGGFFEYVRPRAFDRALASGADVRALVEHDPARIIGRTRAGNLKLSIDDRGLKVDITPPDTTIVSVTFLGPTDLIEPNSYRFEFTGEPVIDQCHDQQNAICTPSPGLQHLIGIKHEVLAQDGKGTGGPGQRQEFRGALE